MMTLEQIIDDIKSDRVKKVILDTDIAYDLDDQYALLYCLGCKKLDVLAYTCVSSEEEATMCYEEAQFIMKKAEREDLLSRIYSGVHSSITYHDGDTDKMGSPVHAPSTQCIIDTARQMPDGELLYICGIGPATNISSAIMLAPDIIDKICVLWLGGQCLDYPEKDIGECNLGTDRMAAQYLMNCGVPLVWFPDKPHGTCTLLITVDDFKNIKGDGNVQKYFREVFPVLPKYKWNYKGNHRILFDVAAPALLDIPEAFELKIITAPVITDDIHYAFDQTRHKVIYMESLEPNTVLNRTWELISSL